jgi:uncharacterized protein YndB with AHSA1/START domain
MYRYTAQREIKKPAEEVFAYLANVAKQTEWVHGVTECHLVEGAAPAAGATAEQTMTFMGKTHVVPLRIVDFEAGRRIMFAKEHPFSIKFGFELEPCGATTRVRYPVEMEPRGFMSLVIKLVGKRTIEGDLVRISKRLEA